MSARLLIFIALTLLASPAGALVLASGTGTGSGLRRGGRLARYGRGGNTRGLGS